MKVTKFGIILSISILVVTIVVAIICNITTANNKETTNTTYETEVYQAEVTLRPTEKEDSQPEATTAQVNTTKQATTKKVVTETTTKQSQKTEIKGSLDFGSNDALMLHKIAIAEAGGENVESMALVMLVVLNRTYSDKFPNSIYGVIHQNKQFSPVANGSYAKAQPNEKSEKAMELVLSGWDESQGALYFESCNGSSWHSRNLTYLFEKGGHRYYK